MFDAIYIKMILGYFLRQTNELGQMAQPEFIYIFQGGNRYKIGRSTNPHARLKFLGATTPYPLKLVDIFGPFNSAYKIEFAAHTILKSRRVRGEWFRITKTEAVAAIQKAIASMTDGTYHHLTTKKKYAYKRMNITMDDELKSALLKIRRHIELTTNNTATLTHCIREAAIDFASKIPEQNK